MYLLSYCKCVCDYDNQSGYLSGHNSQLRLFHQTAEIYSLLNITVHHFMNGGLTHRHIDPNLPRVISHTLQPETRKAHHEHSSGPQLCHEHGQPIAPQ